MCFPFGTRKACGIAAGDMNDVAGGDRMTLSPLERRSHELARATARFQTDHLATELQRAFAALDEDHVHNLIVLFRKSVCIAPNIAEAMVAVIGQRFASG